MEVIYHVYAENVAFVAQRTIFTDTTFQIFENISLETQPKMCFLGAFKAPIAFSNTVRHGHTEDCC